MFDSKGVVSLLIFSAALSGCSVLRMITGRREKPALPRVLVLGVACGNQEIADKISEGILANITSKVESFDPAGFELLISSITHKKAGLPPPPYGQPPVYENGLVPAIDFSSSTFYGKLEKSQYYRTKVNLEVDLDYVVLGEAREKKLTELEEDNLVTAETASIKMLALRDGSFPVKAGFKQGFFEIVAPDRIGGKLADRINKYLKTVRKAAKREAQALRGD
jgi:hypothetical protein